MHPRLAAAIDVVCVMAFVALGRRSHDEGNLVAGTLSTAAPFLIALGLGWLVGRSFWRQPVAWRFGMLLWAVTLTAGMALRHWVFDRGTAVSFIIVAAVFLGMFLVGWRLIAGAIIRRRAPKPVAAGR